MIDFRFQWTIIIQNQSPAVRFKKSKNKTTKNNVKSVSYIPGLGWLKRCIHLSIRSIHNLHIMVCHYLLKWYVSETYPVSEIEFVVSEPVSVVSETSFRNQWKPTAGVSHLPIHCFSHVGYQLLFSCWLVLFQDLVSNTVTGCFFSRWDPGIATLHKTQLQATAASTMAQTA